jgi:hypothetical protein
MEKYMKEFDFAKYNFAQYKSLDEIPDELMNAYLAECEEFHRTLGARLDEMFPDEIKRSV